MPRRSENRAGPEVQRRPPLGPVLEFMRLLWAIDHGLQLTSKRMAVRLGITGLQRLVIRMVGKFPGISAGQVAAILHLDPSTLTPVLHHLVQAGLLDRRSDPRDGRRILLGLTSKGRGLDAPVADTVEASVERALGGLPGTKVQAAEEVLSALARALEATHQPEEKRPSKKHTKTGRRFLVSGGRPTGYSLRQ